MGDRLPIVNFSSDEEMAGTTSRSTSRSYGATQYTELMDGSIPCPSCNGLGSVPKELEGQLVALIPMTDSRLGPSRTKYWVIGALLFCALLMGLLIFFLLARSVDLVLTDMLLPANSVKWVGVNATRRSERKQSYVEINFLARATLVNNNYYPIDVFNQSVVIYKETASKNPPPIASSTNNATITVPIRGSMPLTVNVTVRFSGRDPTSINYLDCYYSSFSHIVVGYVASVRYMAHLERTEAQSKMQLCCGRNATDYCQEPSDYYLPFFKPVISEDMALNLGEIMLPSPTDGTDENNFDYEYCRDLGCDQR